MNDTATALASLGLPPHVANTTSGLIVIGTAAGAGRSSLAHRLAGLLADEGTTITVAPEPTGATGRFIATDGNERAALHQAICQPDVRTIVFDAAPEVGAVAYASALARAGWLIIMTLPLDTVADLLDASVTSQTVACYSTIEGGMLMAAEDIAEALQVVVAYSPDNEGGYAVEHLALDVNIRADLVAQYSHLVDVVGIEA